MIKRITRRFIKNEKGQSMVEFALVLLPLTLLLLGIIEFGWIFNGHITLTSSAREGARLAAANEFATDGQIEEAVQRHTNGSALSNVAVIVNKGNPDPEVVITVNGDIDPIIGFFVRNTMNLEGEATMRLEYYSGEDG